MRAPLSVAVIGASIAGASLAQEAPAPSRYSPRYENTGAPFVSPYPGEQLGRRSGVVVLCCTPDATRRLSCDIASEAPERRGFGATAERSHETTRALTAESYAEYQAAFPNGGAFPVLFVLTSTGSGEAPPRPDLAAQDAMCAVR